MENDKDNIGANHPEYEEHVGNWKLVNDMVESENQTDYLIEQNSHDKSSDNALLNKDYRERASWLGISGFTLAGLIGTAYEKPPVIDLPTSLEYMRKNVDGANTSLDQQIKGSTKNILKKGRSGLFVTYPDTGGAPVSIADQERGEIVSTIHKIDASRIVNWDFINIGAKAVLSLLVFTDEKSVGDKYTHKTIKVRRELSLVQGENGGLIFQDLMWEQKEEEGKNKWVPSGPPTFPKRGDGSNWNEITFQLIGADDNNAAVDKAPMFDIAVKNRDHFRNSASHEESVHYCGQAQPWFSAMDEDTAKRMKEDGLYIGSRRAIGVPEGGTFAFAVSPPNTMVRQAMLDKVDEMAMLGARMIKQGTVAKTATQAAGENAVQHSILSLAVENVAAAYSVALEWASIYQNQPSTVSVEPDKSFMTTPITAQDLTAFKDLVLAGLLSESDQYRYLTRHDMIDPEKALEDWQGELNAGGDVGGPP